MMATSDLYVTFYIPRLRKAWLKILYWRALLTGDDEHRQACYDWLERSIRRKT